MVVVLVVLVLAGTGVLVVLVLAGTGILQGLGKPPEMSNTAS